MTPARERVPPGTGPIVYIGPRPTMSYVFEVVAQLHSGAGPVVVKARGLAIAKAVDVVEVVRNKFLVGGVAIGEIRIATENLVNRTGRETRVSAIAIPLTRTAAEGAPPGGGAPPTSPPDSPRPAARPG